MGFKVYSAKDGVLFETTPLLPMANHYENEIDSFLDCIRESRTNATDIDNAVIASQITYAWAKVDKRGGKINRQCCKELSIELLNSPEAVIERSDCLIVMSPDNPEQHDEICCLPLASGKLTYVDKTFAPDGRRRYTSSEWPRRGIHPFSPRQHCAIRGNMKTSSARDRVHREPWSRPV